MSLTLNTEVGIGLDVCVKDEKPKTLTVARGLLPLERGHDITQRRGSSLFVLMMVRKAVIGGVSENKWYISHAMDRLRSLREDNVVRRIYCCASSRSRSGVEYVAPKNKAFRTILAASPVVETSTECRWRRE